MEEQISKVAAQLNIDREIAEKIIRSEFAFVKENMEEGWGESVHLHHWGKFAVKARFCQIKNYEEDIN